jgi:hypothetical protein
LGNRTGAWVQNGKGADLFARAYANSNTRAFLIFKPRLPGAEIKSR